MVVCWTSALGGRGRDGIHRWQKNICWMLLVFLEVKGVSIGDSRVHADVFLH